MKKINKSCNIFTAMDRELVKKYVESKYGHLGLSEEQMKQALLFEESRIIDGKRNERGFLNRVLSKINSISRRNDSGDAVEREANKFAELLSSDKKEQEKIKKEFYEWKDKWDKRVKHIKDSRNFIVDAKKEMETFFIREKKKIERRKDDFSSAIGQADKYQKILEQDRLIKLMDGYYGEINKKSDLEEPILRSKAVIEDHPRNWYSPFGGKIVKRWENRKNEKGDYIRDINGALEWFESTEWLSLTKEEQSKFRPVPFKNSLSSLKSAGTIRLFLESIDGMGAGAYEFLKSEDFRKLLEWTGVEIPEKLNKELIEPGRNPLHERLQEKLRKTELAKEKVDKVSDAALGRLKASNSGQIFDGGIFTGNPVTDTVREEYSYKTREQDYNSVNGSLNVINLKNHAIKNAKEIEPHVITGKNKNVKVNPLSITDYSILKANGNRVNFSNIDQTDTNYIHELHKEGVIKLKPTKKTLKPKTIERYIDSGEAYKIFKFDTSNENYKSASKYDEFRVDVKDFPKTVVAMNSANEKSVAEAVTGTAKLLDAEERFKEVRKKEYSEFALERSEKLARMFNHGDYRMTPTERKLKEYMLKKYPDAFKIDEEGKATYIASSYEKVDFAELRNNFLEDNVLDAVRKIKGGKVKELSVLNSFPSPEVLDLIIGKMPLEHVVNFQQYQEASLILKEAIRRNGITWNKLGRSIFKKEWMIFRALQKDEYVKVKKGSKEQKTLTKLFKDNLNSELVITQQSLRTAALSAWMYGKKIQNFDGGDLQKRQMIMEKLSENLERSFFLDVDNISYEEQKRAIDEAQKQGKELLIRYDESKDKIFVEHKMVLQDPGSHLAIAGSEISSRQVMTIDVSKFWEEADGRAALNEFIKVNESNSQKYVIDRFINKTIIEAYSDLKRMKKEKGKLVKEGAVDKDAAKKLEEFMKETTKFFGSEYTNTEKEKLLNTIATLHKVSRVQENVDKLLEATENSAERLAKFADKVNQEINESIAETAPELLKKYKIPYIDDSVVQGRDLEMSKAKLANAKIETSKTLYRAKVMAGGEKEFRREKKLRRSAMNKEYGAFKTVDAEITPNKTVVTYKTGDYRHLNLKYEIVLDNETNEFVVTRSLGYTGLNEITERYNAAMNPKEYETFKDMYNYFKTEDETKKLGSRIREVIKNRTIDLTKKKARDVVEQRNLGIIADRVKAEFGPKSTEQYAQAVKDLVAKEAKAISFDQVRTEVDKNESIIKANENKIANLRTEALNLQDYIQKLITYEKRDEVGDYTDRLDEVNSQIRTLEKQNGDLREANVLRKQETKVPEHINELIDFVGSLKKIKTVGDFSYVLQKLSMEFTGRPDNLHNIDPWKLNRTDTFMREHQQSEMASLEKGITRRVGNESVSEATKRQIVKRLRNYISTKHAPEIESKQKLVNDLSEVASGLMDASIAFTSFNIPKFEGWSENSEQYDGLVEKFKAEKRAYDMVKRVISDPKLVAKSLTKFGWTPENEQTYWKEAKKIAGSEPEVKRIEISPDIIKSAGKKSNITFDQFIDAYYENTRAKTAVVDLDGGAKQKGKMKKDAVVKMAFILAKGRLGKNPTSEQIWNATYETLDIAKDIAELSKSKEYIKAVNEKTGGSYKDLTSVPAKHFSELLEAVEETNEDLYIEDVTSKEYDEPSWFRDFENKRRTARSKFYKTFYKIMDQHLNSAKQSMAELNRLSNKNKKGEYKEIREARINFERISKLLKKEMIYGDDGDFAAIESILKSAKILTQDIRGHEEEYRNLKKATSNAEASLKASRMQEQNSDKIVNAAKKIFEVIPKITPKQFFTLIQKIAYNKTRKIDNVESVLNTLEKPLSNSYIKKLYESLSKSTDNAEIGKSFIKAITGFGYSHDIRKSEESLASANVKGIKGEEAPEAVNDWFDGKKIRNKKWIKKTIEAFGFEKRIEDIIKEDEDFRKRVRSIPDLMIERKTKEIADIIATDIQKDIEILERDGVSKEVIDGYYDAIAIVESMARNLPKDKFLKMHEKAIAKISGRMNERTKEASKEIDLLKMKINIINSIGTPERWEYIKDKLNMAIEEGNYSQSEYAMLPKNVWDFNDAKAIKYNQDITNFLFDKDAEGKDIKSVKIAPEEVQKLKNQVDATEKVEAVGTESGKAPIDWERASSEEIQSSGGVALSGGYSPEFEMSREIDGKTTYIDSFDDLNSKDYYMVVKNLNSLNLMQKSKFNNKDVISFLNGTRESEVAEGEIAEGQTEAEGFIKNSTSRKDKLHKFLVLAENSLAATGKTIHEDVEEDLIARLASEVKMPEKSDLTRMELEYMDENPAELGLPEEVEGEYDVNEEVESSEDSEELSQGNKWEYKDEEEDEWEDEEHSVFDLAQPGDEDLLDEERDDMYNC